MGQNKRSCVPNFKKKAGGPRGGKDTMAKSRNLKEGGKRDFKCMIGGRGKKGMKTRGVQGKGERTGGKTGKWGGGGS